MKTDEQKLNIVGAAAQLLLENGSETYRVEETAQRMAKGFGMEQVNIAAFPTSVFLEADGRAYVRRISRRGTNSRRIAMVNEISREVDEQLNKIHQSTVTPTPFSEYIRETYGKKKD